MGIRAFVVAAPLVGLLIAACSSKYDSDSDPVVAAVDGGGSGDGETKESGGPSDASVPNDAGEAGPAAALCPLGCLPIAPVGWTGPSATYDGPGPDDITCPGVYSLHEVYARNLLTTASHTCACGASPIQPECQANVSFFSIDNCTGSVIGTAAPIVGTCYDLPASAAGWRVDTAHRTSSCQAPSPTLTKAVPNVDRALVACGLSQAAGCEGRIDCTPTPLPLPAPLTRLCIHRDGDEACPNETYSQRVVVSKTIADDRACAKCEVETSGNCETFAVKEGSTCTGLSGKGYFGACVDIDSARSFFFSKPQCVMSGGAPTGGLAARDPVTFCCNK